MGIDGYEAITIVVILAIIFLWGPQKLPEIARSIAQARKEFDKASKEFSSPANPSSILNPPTSTQATAQSTQDPMLIAAKSIGISTEGKTKEELAKEILDRTTKK